MTASQTLRSKRQLQNAKSTGEQGKLFIRDIADLMSQYSSAGMSVGDMYSVFKATHEVMEEELKQQITR